MQHYVTAQYSLYIAAYYDSSTTTGLLQGDKCTRIQQYRTILSSLLLVIQSCIRR